MDALFDRILRIDIVTGGQSVISTGGLLQDPNGIAFDNADSLLISDHDTMSLLLIDPQTGSQSVYWSGGIGDLKGIRVLPIPDPSTSLLLLAGLVGWGAVRRGIVGKAKPT